MVRVADKIPPHFRARCRRRALRGHQSARLLLVTRCRSSAYLGTFDCSSPSNSGEVTDAFLFIPGSVLSGLKCLHDHGTVHRDLKYVAPLSSTFPIFIEIFGYNTWPANRPENIIFHTKDQSSDIVIADFGMCVAQILSPETCLIRVICLQCQTPRCHRRTAHTRRRKSRICSPRGAEPKAERKACRPWSIGWDCLLSLLIIYGTMEY